MDIPPYIWHNLCVCEGVRGWGTCHRDSLFSIPFLSAPPFHSSSLSLSAGVTHTWRSCKPRKAMPIMEGCPGRWVATWLLQGRTGRAWTGKIHRGTGSSMETWIIHPRFWVLTITEGSVCPPSARPRGTRTARSITLLTAQSPNPRGWGDKVWSLLRSQNPFISLKIINSPK